MSEIITIVNQKGGTGKSACTANLEVAHVCVRFGNLKSGEIDKLVTRLKLEDIKAVEKHEHNRIWNFDYRIMYKVLLENEKCRRVCEKNKYSDWMRIIYRCCMDD